MILTKCKGNALKFYKGGANFKAKTEKNNEKKKVSSIKPAVLLIHESRHFVKDAEIFQTSLHKTVFGN
jgi:hypothetical protein